MNKDKLKEARCMKCDRLLGEYNGRLKIKCRRCGTYNSFDDK